MTMKILETRKFAPGALVLREGDESSEAFLIRSGTAEVFMRNSEGKEVTIAVLDDGEIFGEMGLILDRPRSATVRARTALDVDVVDPTLFKDLFPGTTGETLRAIILILVERLRTANTQVIDLAQEIEQTGGEHPEDLEPLRVRLQATTPEARAALAGKSMVETTKFPFRVGRDDQDGAAGFFHMNDLCLQDDDPYMISRSHFSLVRNHNTVFYQDRGSRYGAVVNGKRVGGGYRNPARMPLKRGKNTLRLSGTKTDLVLELFVEKPEHDQDGLWDKVRGYLHFPG